MTTSHTPEKSKSEKISVAEPSISDVPANNDRRKVLKKLAVGTVAVAGCSVLPSKWSSPVVEFGALPAHAVTSGTPVAATEPAAEPAATTTAVAGETREDGLYWGRHNGNRPTWYFSKPMRDYPQTFTVVIEGCATVTVTNNNGTRFVEGSTIIKQSDVVGRGMAVIGSAGCYSKSCYVMY